MNKDAAKQVNCDFKKLFNVDDNIKCGTLYLCWLMSHFAGPDLNTALKMYHYGPGVKNPNKGQQYANKIQKCASCLDGGGICDKCNPTNTPKKKKKP